MGRADAVVSNDGSALGPLTVAQLVAVDPGGVTGIAIGEFGPDGVTVSAVEHAPMLAVQTVGDLLGHPHTLVACESFIPRPGVRTWQPDALEVIGALRYLCYRHDVPFVLQSPADAKAFSTNERLSHLGWKHPTKGGHADDALRHLLLLAVRGRFLDPARLILEEEK